MDDRSRVYDFIRMLADASDSELEDAFGTCELDDIVLSHATFEELEQSWGTRISFGHGTM